jgi:uncharacterized membrane protein YphA (DoxX/SURF4 family)
MRGAARIGGTHMTQQSRRKLGWALMLVGRIALGVIFIVAAVSKIKPLPGMAWTVASVKTSLAMFSMGVDSYQLLPPWAVSPVAHILPFFEIVLGVWLISGIGLRLSSLLATLALCGFIAAMGSVWHRGLTVTCGCFGQGGPPIGPKDMMRDGFLFLPIAVALVIGSFLIHRKSRPSPASNPLPAPQV